MRKEIFNKTHFNVDRAVEINEESKIFENENEVHATSSQRRAAPIAANNQELHTGRKTTPIIIKK